MLTGRYGIIIKVFKLVNTFTIIKSHYKTILNIRGNYVSINQNHQCHASEQSIYCATNESSASGD